ncbi:hypothetical protein [Thalassospira lucentensis]|uniref:hypothetical protein n=1 Tax=Thalassospira lucentensis TaxID=168935 RepID=UPI0029430876|nr:hypothetical protein [Thalassospira lucentensis]WOI09024.1 hypothetical protein R1T41_00075 [Thalassospira lucentensis]
MTVELNGPLSFTLPEELDENDKVITPERTIEVPVSDLQLEVLDQYEGYTEGKITGYVDEVGDIELTYSVDNDATNLEIDTGYIDSDITCDTSGVKPALSPE